MRNRAKCKLCGTIIESVNVEDEVVCKCGEISIGGGNQAFLVAARDFSNFLRVDDEGVEIEVKVKDKLEIKENPRKEDLLKELQMMIENIERLPPAAMTAPISHYDYAALMILVLAIFKSD